MRNILVVRVDAIGDYVLFRDYLRLVRKSRPYSDAKITLLGNVVWRTLFEELDGGTVDECVWLNRKDVLKRGADNFFPGVWKWRPAFRKNRGALKAELRRRRFDEVLSPVINRDPLLDELLCGAAPRICGVRAEYPMRTDEIYTDLFAVRDRGAFVFRQNASVMCQMLEMPCELDRPAIDIRSVSKSASFTVPDKPYMILFVGASHWTKRWPCAFYAKVARHLVEHYHVDVILAGGREDCSRAKKVTFLAGSPHVHSEAGAWSLPQLAYFIGKAELVVSNDSCAVHFAAATGVPCVCVTNGIAGRSTFWPYAPDMGCSNVTLFSNAPVQPGHFIQTQIRSYYNLMRISPDQVCSAVESLLKAAP